MGLIRETAKQFLEALMNGEPINVKDGIEAAEANGISHRTLRRAKDDLGIKARKDGPFMDGERIWRWHPAAKREAGQLICVNAADEVDFR